MIKQANRLHNSSSEKGSAIILVLGLIIVLVISFSALSFQSRQTRHTTVNLLESNISYETARVSAECFWRRLENVLAGKSNCPALYPSTGFNSSPLYKAAYENSLLSKTTLSLNHSDLNLDEVYRELADKFGLSGITAQATMAFNSVSGFPPMPVGEGMVSLSVRLSSANNRDSKEFRFERPIKLVQMLPPLVSKFSLFVRKCESEQFNTGLSSYGTAPDNKKLVLINNREGFFGKPAGEYWKKSGWVFLGGEKVILNLDGSHPVLSEHSDFFMFFPRYGFSGFSKDIPAFLFHIPGADDKFKVRITPMGCYSEILSSTLLRQIIMDPALAEADPQIAFSSVLRLFGSAADLKSITPTKVFGNVFARYILFSALVVDDGSGIPVEVVHPHGDGPNDKIRLIFPLRRTTYANKFLPKFGLPPLIHGTRSISFYQVVTDQSAPRLMSQFFPSFNDQGSENSYVRYMTKISTSDFADTSTGNRLGSFASYNTLYDMMFQGLTYEGPEQARSYNLPPAANLQAQDYPNSGISFFENEFPTLTGENEINLQTYDPAESYKGNPAFFSNQYDNFESFANDIGQNPGSEKINLSHPLTIMINSEKKLQLPDLSLNASVVIATKGDIEVRSVEIGPESVDSPAARLVLISLEGSITLKGPLMKRTAILAPNGKVSFESSVEIDGGFICAEELDSNSLSTHGGTIRYFSKNVNDPGFDPADEKSLFYGLSLILGPPGASRREEQR